MAFYNAAQDKAQELEAESPPSEPDLKTILTRIARGD